jgi:hypothetical protein
MDRGRFVLGLGLPALLAGCDAGDTVERQAAQEHDQSDGAVVGGNHRTSGRIGPVRYQYDAGALTMVEVVVEVPPSFESEVWGTKLIPVQRAAMLGQQLCQYGESGRIDTCEAENEAGLVLALLERPLADYQQAFVENGLGDELSPTQLDGSRGFTVTAQAEGSGIEYHFLPLRERTILLARQFHAGQDAGGEAVQDVIRSIARGLEASGA